VPSRVSPLEQLRAGKLDARGYAEATIQEGTAHLGQGPLVEEIRALLRSHLQTDPALRDLFQTATDAPVPEEQ
jgi:hypothetical protein